MIQYPQFAPITPITGRPTRDEVDNRPEVMAQMEQMRRSIYEDVQREAAERLAIWADAANRWRG